MHKAVIFVATVAILAGACGEDTETGQATSAVATASVAASPTSERPSSPGTLPATVPTSSEPTPGSSAAPTTRSAAPAPSARSTTLGELLERIEASFVGSTAREIVHCRLVGSAGTHVGDHPLADEAMTLDRGMVFTCIIEGDPPGDYGEPLIVVLDPSGTIAMHSATDGTHTSPIDSPPGLLCREFLAHNPMLEDCGQMAAYSMVLAYWFLEGQPSRMDVDGNGVPCELLFPPDVVSSVLAGA